MHCSGVNLVSLNFAPLDQTDTTHALKNYAVRHTVFATSYLLRMAL